MFQNLLIDSLFDLQIVLQFVGQLVIDSLFDLLIVAQFVGQLVFDSLFDLLIVAQIVGQLVFDSLFYLLNAFPEPTSCGSIDLLVIAIRIIRVMSSRRVIHQLISYQTILPL